MLNLADPTMSSVSSPGLSRAIASPSVTRHSAPHSPQMRPLRCLGKWQLCQLAGCGSFTDVYLAKPLGCPPNWPSDYAVKVLRPSYVNDEQAAELLQREAEVAAAVSHPHLVAILESHLNESQKYLVMPKLDGVSVGQIIERAGHMSVRQTLWIVRQIAEALEALHRVRWLHGDVKPDNMMFSSDGHATLIDLGFALRFSEAMLTETRAAKGTLNYMAPETMTSAHCSDQRSDMYSLGISMFQMLTGRLPFEAVDASGLIEAHREQPLPDPRRFHPAIPAGVTKLLSQMTAKQPLRRPQTTQELIRDLVPLEVAAMKAERNAARSIRSAPPTARSTT